MAANDSVGETPRQRLGRLLAAERKARGWSQEDLAVKTQSNAQQRRSGVSKRTISDIETGKDIESRSADRVASVLGWLPGSVQQVLEGGDPMRSNQVPPQVSMRQALIGELAAASDEEIVLVAQLLRKARRS